MEVEILVERIRSASWEKSWSYCYHSRYSKRNSCNVASLLPFFESIAMSIRLFLGLVAVIGHMYPVFASFKGGKAVATSGGVLLGIQLADLYYRSSHFFIVLKLTKMVSLTSMIVAVVCIYLFALFYYFWTGDFYLMILIWSFSVSSFFIDTVQILSESKQEPSQK